MIAKLLRPDKLATGLANKGINVAQDVLNEVIDTIQEEVLDEEPKVENKEAPNNNSKMGKIRMATQGWKTRIFNSFLLLCTTLGDSYLITLLPAGIEWSKVLLDVALIGNMLLYEITSARKDKK